MPHPLHPKYKDFEIRDQQHLMDAEGTTDNKPNEFEIKQYLKHKNWNATNISISYDTMQGFWRWNCDIESLTPNSK